MVQNERYLLFIITKRDYENNGNQNEGIDSMRIQIIPHGIPLNRNSSLVFWEIWKLISVST